MRGGGGGGVGGVSNLKMGVPTNGGGGGGGMGHGDQRPSKLMMMREDYHKKMLKEKEQKMVQLYEDSQMSQKKTMMRMMRGGSGEGSGQVPNGNQTMANGGGASVRDFFNERRRMEAKGVPVPPIDDHFRRAKGYSSPGGWSSRTGSGNSAKKLSAGRDRSQPLAPIRRPSDTREAAKTGNAPKEEKDAGFGPKHAEPNPFNARPKLVKHNPLPPTNGYANQYQAQQQQKQQQQHQQQQQQREDEDFLHPRHAVHHIDNNNNDKPHQNPPSQSRFGFQANSQQRNAQPRQPQPPNNAQPRQPQPPNSHHPHQIPQRQKPPPQQQQRHEAPTSPQPPPQSPQSPQHHTPKHQPQNKANNGKIRPAGIPTRTPKSTPVVQRRQPPKQAQQNKMTDFQKWQLEQNKAREDRLKKFNDNNKNDKDQGSWGDPGDDDDNDDDDSNDMGNNGYEYEDEGEEDNGQEDEVKRMERELLEKIEREKAELERIRREKIKAEEEEKREIEENKKRAKAEKIKQKKLEEQRRKEDEQRRREEEEDERRERQREERDRKEEEKRRREEDRRRKEEDKLAAKRDQEEQRRHAKLQKQQPKDSSRSSHGPSSYGQYDDTPRESPAIPSSSGLTMGDIDDRPAVTNAADTSYYAQIAKSSEAKGSVGSLAKCKVCGRSFAVDRLKKHQTACSKASKPRKEFDSSKKRVEGTEAAQYVGRPKKEPPKKKNNWRSQHEEFINSLRYAKKAAQYEKDGKDVRELTPPPTKTNPDLVQCPNCGRTFNESAAQRHIPRCKELKTKPPPVNNRRR